MKHFFKVRTAIVRSAVLLALFLSVQNKHATGQCLTSSIVVNTGYDPVMGTALAPCAPDPLWYVSTLSADANADGCGGGCVPSYPAVVIPHLVGWWTPPPPQSGWLSFICANAYPTTAVRPGTGVPSVYTMTLSRPFNVCGDDHFDLNLNIANDNYITNINIDGGANLITPQAAGFTLWHFNVMTNYYIPQVPLTCGPHVLNVTIVNDPVNHMNNGHGLCVTGTITSTSMANTLVDESIAACAGYICPTPLPIMGPATVCEGSMITLHDPVPGGVWSSSGAGTVTLMPTLPGYVDVTGISGGSVLISYTLGCITEIYCIYVTPRAYVCMTCAPNPVGDDYFIYTSTLGATVDYIACIPSGGSSTFTGVPLSYWTGSYWSTTVAIGDSWAPCFVRCGSVTLLTITAGGCTWPAYCPPGGPKPGRIDKDLSAVSEGAAGFSIAPNPNNGTISIKGVLFTSEKTTDATVEMTDVLGKTVFTGRVKVEKGKVPGSIDVNDRILNGVYFLKITAEGKEHQARFVLSR